MRKVIFAINITADGCCDHTKFNGDDELHEYFTQLMQDVDLLVYGRKTYELMIPYWPEVARSNSETKAINEFAKKFDSISKIVFSKSLDKTEDKHTRIVHADLRDEILRLKQEGGGNILLGGVDIPSQLMKLGLVDEFYFLIHPIIAGAGARLLDGISLEENLQLKLLESRTLESGRVAHHYVRS